jgi:hypothetical protein
LIRRFAEGHNGDARRPAALLVELAGNGQRLCDVALKMPPEARYRYAAKLFARFQRGWWTRATPSWRTPFAERTETSRMIPASGYCATTTYML